MDDLLLDIPQGKGPIYRRLSLAVRQALRQGRLRPGERLPSTRRLAQQLGVHRHTVMLSLDELVAEGWLESQPGWGYRVVGGAPVSREESAPSATTHSWDLRLGDVLSEPCHPHSTPYQQSNTHMDCTRGTPYQQSNTHMDCTRGTPYRFPSGQPDLRSFPAEEYYSYIREALRRCQPDDLLGYSEPEGRPFFCEQLGHYLRRARGLELQSEELVVTHGCQEAIYLLGQLLLRPGDRVAVEELGYPNAWQALRCCGAELVPVEIDDQGIVPDSLERALEEGGVKLIYLTPLHQYPTTATLSRSRRQAVYRLASRYQVSILEDDYDFELHYRCMSVPPMKAEDPDGRILYCSTFSKVLHPSARLGFAIVPAPVARLMKELKRVVSRQNDSLVQEAVAGWMAEGGFERHLRRMRRLYETRRDVMLECLAHNPRQADFRLPDGGMCVWVELGLDSVRVAEEALKLGVHLRPGPYYALPGRKRGWDGFRLGFAYPRPEEIREGMARFWQACERVR